MDCSRVELLSRLCGLLLAIYTVTAHKLGVRKWVRSLYHRTLVTGQFTGTITNLALVHKLGADQWIRTTEGTSISRSIQSDLPIQYLHNLVCKGGLEPPAVPY